MLRKLPHKSQIVQVQIGTVDSLTDTDALNKLETLLKVNLVYHQKWFYLNIIAAPFTAAAGVLPGPNVFFFWNMMRLYSHYQALESSKFLSEKLVSNSIQVVRAENLAQFISQEKRTLRQMDEFLRNEIGKEFIEEEEE
jgi:hypothetical protein